jgi:hypothetical protein
MRNRGLLQLAVFGLMTASVVCSSHPLLTPLVSQFLAGVAKTDAIYRNQFGSSPKSIKLKNVSDLERVVEVEFPCGSKVCREEFTFRVLQAELFLTEEFADLGISGVTKIEWTYGLLKNARNLDKIGEGQVVYLVLSRKDGKWTSPRDDAWAAGIFSKAQSSWAKDKRGKHEVLN